MAESSIEWTHMTWNPVTGCSKVSQGCKHCYAEVMAKRLQAMGIAKYRNNFEVTLHPDALNAPYSWRKSRLIFVNSMSDLFHEQVGVDFIEKVFRVMNDCPQHTFQVLTKRAERLLALSSSLEWSNNIWMGVSVEHKRVIDRIGYLKRSSAKIKFLSLEPLLGPLSNLPLTGIDWAIVGGESGHKARRMDYDWVIDIRDQCEAIGVPFFFKQWGGRNKKAAGRALEGKTYNEMPNTFADPTTQSAKIG